MAASPSPSAGALARELARQFDRGGADRRPRRARILPADRALEAASAAKPTRANGRSRPSPGPPALAAVDRADRPVHDRARAAGASALTPPRRWPPSTISARAGPGSTSSAAGTRRNSRCSARRWSTKRYDQAAGMVRVRRARSTRRTSRSTSRASTIDLKGVRQPPREPAAAAAGDDERRLRRGRAATSRRRTATFCSPPSPRSRTARQHIADIRERGRQAGPRGRRLHRVPCRLPRDAGGGARTTTRATP